MNTGFWWGSLRKETIWRGPDVEGSIILIWIEGRVVHRVLVGKPERKRAKWRPRRRWEIILRCMEGRHMHRVLVGKPEGKRPLGRPRRRWKDNVKMEGGQRCAQVSGAETCVKETTG
jgi:hypothetical protein